MSILRRFVRNESGATAIEYGLIAAGISVAIIGAPSIRPTRLRHCCMPVFFFRSDRRQ